MKRFYFLLLATMLVVPCFAGAVGVADEPEDPPRPIDFTEVVVPQDVVPESNNKPITSGYVDKLNSEISLSFAANVGKVVVSVCDVSGQPLSRHICDTSVQSEFILPAPAEDGLYTINVENYKYEANGRFDVMKAW